MNFLIIHLSHSPIDSEDMDSERYFIDSISMVDEYGVQYDIKLTDNKSIVNYFLLWGELDEDFNYQYDESCYFPISSVEEIIGYMKDPANLSKFTLITKDYDFLLEILENRDGVQISEQYKTTYGNNSSLKKHGDYYVLPDNFEEEVIKPNMKYILTMIDTDDFLDHRGRERGFTYLGVQKITKKEYEQLVIKYS